MRSAFKVSNKRKCLLSACKVCIGLSEVWINSIREVFRSRAELFVLNIREYRVSDQWLLPDSSLGLDSNRSDCWPPFISLHSPSQHWNNSSLVLNNTWTRYQSGAGRWKCKSWKPLWIPITKLHSNINHLFQLSLALCEAAVVSSPAAAENLGHNNVQMASTGM